MTDGTGGATAPASDGAASQYVDTEGVYAFVAEQLGRARDWSLSHHGAGLGNETLFLGWDARQFVLRRPPLADLPTDVHDVLREYRLLELLDWTDLPTPRPVRVCRDASVAGAAFTVQQRRDGDVLRHGEPASYASPEFRDQVGTELVESLANIHTLTPTDLADEPAALDRLTRTPVDQVSTWRERFETLTAATDRSVPGADDVADWLAANAPESSDRTLVHGDFTLANVQCSRETPPTVAGILDWERGGIGDPLTDLGSLVAFWYDDPDAAVLPNAIVPTFTARPGFPSRATLVDRYERATGRSFDRDRFYRALALFEQATVCESYYLRHLRGVSDRPAFAGLETAVPELIEQARRVIDGNDPL